MMRTRPELIGSFGMVASTHWLASAAGMSVPEQGGNAVDAAGFAMQIVEPHLSGPAGDLSAIVWRADDDRASVTWNTPAARPATTPLPQPVNSAPPITQLLTGSVTWIEAKAVVGDG